jgi:hypothetical protein
MKWGNDLLGSRDRRGESLPKAGGAHVPIAGVLKLNECLLRQAGGADASVCENLPAIQA